MNQGRLGRGQGRLLTRLLCWSYLEGAAHPRMDPAEVRVPAGLEIRRGLRHRVRAASVDHVVAERARVPGAVGERVVGHVLAIAGPAAGGDAVADVRRLILVDEGHPLA